MFINVRKDGKIIACYRKELIVRVVYILGTCTVLTVDGNLYVHTITEQDFSDLVNQLQPSAWQLW